MNDARWLTAGRSKRWFISPRCEGSDRRQDLKGCGQSKKNKIESNKSADLKGPSVAQLIMSMRRKDEKRDMKRSKNRKVRRLWGNPSDLLFCLNIWKLIARGGFFPWETCNLMLVRGTISFYNQGLQILPVGGSTMWNMSMWLNEQMLNVNYFIFSCASLAVRAF